MRDSPADISGTWTAQTTCFAAQAQRYTSDHPIAPRLSPRLKIFGGRFQDPNRARERPHRPRGGAPQPRAGPASRPDPATNQLQPDGKYLAKSELPNLILPQSPL